MKKELILLYGGRSGEHEVSLRSAASVYNHLHKEKYNLTLIAISKKGSWYVQANPEGHQETLQIDTDPQRLVGIHPMKGFTCMGELITPHIVFPLIHGTFGEDGTLQGLLEMCGFPYVGATVGGSYLGMDKEMSKTVWMRNGIDIIPFRAVRKDQYHSSKSSDVNKSLVEKFGLPLFVKPAMAGSSVGVSKVETIEELTKAINHALEFDAKAVVEPAIIGKEIECSVIGNHRTESFPPGEIAPTHDFYDYEAKYIDPDGAGLIIPAEISEEKARVLRSIAEKAYKVLDLRGFARVDFFIEEGGRILINEVNTIPGFTNISMFSMMCEVGGLPYARMLDRLIELAEEQFEDRSSLKFSYD